MISPGCGFPSWLAFIEVDLLVAYLRTELVAPCTKVLNKVGVVAWIGGAIVSAFSAWSHDKLTANFRTIWDLAVFARISPIICSERACPALMSSFPALSIALIPRAISRWLFSANVLTEVSSEWYAKPSRLKTRSLESFPQACHSTSYFLVVCIQTHVCHMESVFE